MRIVNENADRYARLSNDRGFNPISLGSVGSGMRDEMLRNDTYSSPAGRRSLLDNLSFGGSDNSRFSSANTPTTQVEPLADTVAARNAAKEEAEIEAKEKITSERIARETAASNARVKAAKAKAAAKKKADSKGPDNWSPPKNNGYAGQSGKKSTKGKARTGYSFGL